jgi:hypothetical protein
MRTAILFLALALTVPALAADAPRSASPPPAEEVLANTGTTRVAFGTSEWLDVGLDVNGVIVDRVKLRRAGAITSLFLKHDEANRGKVVVRNTTSLDVEPALALAVFDKDGHLVGAANTGLRLRTLKAGEMREMDIHLGGVFRHLDEGESLYVSLEY